LVNEMTQADPSKRPTMDEVAKNFEAIVSSLSTCTLRSRVAKKQDHPLHSLYLSGKHWVRRVRFVLSRRPAIPSPPC
ncbi:hypothetical protein K523DRAFT_256698, partial [Schizophyllum commune Tattone D]